jgi:hypothetical protein
MELDDEAIARILGEFAEVDLGDPRRTLRVLKMVAALAKHPNQSLPEALGTSTALEGAYRILNNEHVDFDDMLAGHREQTVARAEQARDVLVLHDTTTCRFEHADPREIGYLPTGKAGFFAHVGLVVDAQHHRRPLGVLHVEPYWRTKRSGRGSRKKHLGGRELASWAGREAERWARGVQECQEQLSDCSVIHVMDREGDKYELLAHLQQHEERFVIRSSYDRRLSCKEHEGHSLREMARQQPVLLQREVHLSRRTASTAPRSQTLAPSRQSRPATLSITAAAAVLRRPNSLSTDFPATIELNVVHVQELNPPKGENPVVWMLLTSEPIESSEQVERVIDIYRYRWLIEELFKALKTGCLYEKRMFETRHPLLNLLATSLPIAVELLWMRGRVADDPDAPAQDIVTPLQVEILRTMGHRPLSAKPTALQALLAIAGLGGHLKRNGSPGWQVLRRGYQRLLDYEAGWTAARAKPAKRNL